jgi:hypothetical protein
MSKLTFPNPIFSRLANRRVRAGGSGGGKRCSTPQNPPRSALVSALVRVFVLFEIRCAALQGKRKELH